MSSVFLEPLVLDGDALDLCPYCGGNNLHQEDVSVFTPERPETIWHPGEGTTSLESRTRVTHVITDGTVTTASLNSEHTNDPSSQGRGALAVEFSCESCDNKPTLAMFQHKGTTFIGWKK